MALEETWIGWQVSISLQLINILADSDRSNWLKLLISKLNILKVKTTI